MKKTTFAAGFAALITELALFISFCKLSDNSSYYWIGVGVSALLAAVTLYYIVAKLADTISDTYSERLKKDREDKKELAGFINDCIKSVNINIENLHSRITELSAIQEKIISDNAGFCAELRNTVGVVSKANSESIERLTAAINSNHEMLQSKMSELSAMHERIIKSNDKLVNELNSSVTALSSTVQSNIEYNNNLFSKAAEMSENAESKISDLTEKMSAYNDDVKKFRQDVIDIYKLIDSAIKKGIKDFTDNRNSFETTLNRTIADKLNEYNSSFDKLSQKIEELINVCNSNTNSYKDSLDFIRKSQAESNSLTKEDIKLLQQLVKR